MYNIKKIIQDNIEVKEKMIKNCIGDLISASDMMYKAITRGKKILWCGNGGSAADAQHMAAELMGGLVSHERRPIASIALTTDTSFITAWTNDTDYSTIFSRQVEGIGEPGDILIAISTSGNSRNIIQAIKTAEKKGLFSIILTGSQDSVISNMGNVQICIPSKNTQRIQEGHLLAEHILCERLEERFIKDN
jgi:D-sedoheptulose 7-phosphate isomerase